MQDKVKNLKRSAASALKCHPDAIKVHKIKAAKRPIANVWKLQTPTHQWVAAKKILIPKFHEAERFSPFEVEVKTLSLLGSMGCSVPKLVGFESSEELIFMEWCGDRTLDDFCQSDPTSPKKELIRKVVAEFCKVELAFSSKKDEVLDYMFPFDYPNFLRKQLQGHISSARRAIGILAHQRGEVSRSWHRKFEELLDELQLKMTEYRIAIGALDYNARNILIAANKPYFIDFSRIGNDWPARRLVQYATSLGANRSSGRFISLLSPEAIMGYASLMGDDRVVAEVEHHYLLFFLAAISKIAESKGSNDDYSRRLLRSWGDPDRRLKSAFRELLKPLGSDQLAEEIRGLIGQIATN